MLFNNLSEVTRFFKDADTLKNNRIIFDICKNKYRLIVKFEYQFQSAFIRFIGTYKAYDKLKNIDYLTKKQMETLNINLDSIIIKPITNEHGFEEANEVINRLIDADMIENPEQRQKALEILNAITILAIEYEKKHYPIPSPDPIEAIKERMKMLNLSQKDVAKYFGGENRVSEVLNKKRNLNLKMIKELHKNLGISANILLA